MTRSRIDTLPHQQAHHHWTSQQGTGSDRRLARQLRQARWGNWPAFGLYLSTGIAVLAVLAHWSSTEGFPQLLPALFIGSIVGCLAATQSWFAHQKWRSILRLIVGLLAVQLIHPVLAARLGGPAEQWWSALILLLLTSQAVNAIMAQSTDSKTCAAGDYGLVDLLALGTLFAILFELAKLATQFPQILLESFAWFGGAATLIGISRFGLQQILEYWLDAWQNRSTPAYRHGGRRSTICCLLETVGILTILALLNGGILLTLNYFRGSNPVHQGLMIVLVTAQAWQALDLWINHLAQNPQAPAGASLPPRVSVAT